MGRSNQLNTLLVEIMIAVLFFALSSTIVLETFVVTHNQSRMAGIYDEVLMKAQNLADRIYASEDPAEMLRQEGFEQDDQGWKYTDQYYVVNISTEREYLTGGYFVDARINVFHNDEMLISLPCSRYFPGEVQP